jgi:ribosomal protein S8
MPTRRKKQPMVNPKRGLAAYQQSLARSRSLASALKVRKQRKRLIREMDAFKDDNKQAWEDLNKRKRIIAGPVSRIRDSCAKIKKCHQYLSGMSPTEGTSSTTKEEMATLSEQLKAISDSLKDLGENIAPVCMELAQCKAKQLALSKQVDECVTRSHGLDRAMVRACQGVINRDPMFLYIIDDYPPEILPSSMYHHRKVLISAHKSKQAAAAAAPTTSEAATAAEKGTFAKSLIRGHASGNAPSARPIGKSQTNAKKAANRARQDVTGSMVRHVPVCVVDPSSYTGLAGVMRG